MKIWSVFVYDGLNHRFLDTSWAREEAATQRGHQLTESMQACGFGGKWKIVEMTVEDCEIKERKI